MNVAFHYHDAPARKPVVFETIIAEKNGGGILANCDVDLVEGMAVGMNSDGKFAPIKVLVVVEDAENDATTIKVAKNSGMKVGEFYAHGKKSVAATAVDTEVSKDHDVVTISLGVALKKGDILFQAASASASSATPVFAPMYLLGVDVPANSGDALVKLVNVANIRKETAPVANEVVALMKGIFKI